MSKHSRIFKSLLSQSYRLGKNDKVENVRLIGDKLIGTIYEEGQHILSATIVLHPDNHKYDLFVHHPNNQNSSVSRGLNLEYIAGWQSLISQVQVANAA